MKQVRLKDCDGDDLVDARVAFTRQVSAAMASQSGSTGAGSRLLLLSLVLCASNARCSASSDHSCVSLVAQPARVCGRYLRRSSSSSRRRCRRRCRCSGWREPSDESVAGSRRGRCSLRQKRGQRAPRS
jgi:hypothetical protein